MFELKINNTDNSHEIILSKCNLLIEFYLKNPTKEIIFDIRNLTFIYPDYALLLLCSFKYLEQNGIIVKGKMKYTDSYCIKYLARMGFFRNLNIDIPSEVENITKSSFVEIQKYDELNQVEICNSLLRVIKSNSVINDNVFTSLDYCFNEILDNVLLHSEIKHGWVVMQYFPNMNAIRLIVCDFGIGVNEALKSKYNFTEEESIKKCIESGITNGKGQGHGLYATSEFVKLNRGWLSIITGNKKLDLNEDELRVRDVAFWQGTCIYLRINTNIDVDYTKFTSRCGDYKEHVIERFEDMFN